MKYRELMELYKSGKLPQEEREKIENDIERQQAISEYLFDSEEIPEMDEFEGNEPEEENETDKAEEAQFTRLVRATIRKAFIKMGVIVGAVVLAVVLFIIFALPHIVDCFYYDPTEHSGGSNDNDTNRISLDLAVYTELYIPERYRDIVAAESEGYGEYAINVMNYASYMGIYSHVGGRIERNKLVLYDSNLLNFPSYNMFLHDRAGVGSSFAGLNTENYDMSELQDLHDGEEYFAYITLDEVISYSEFVELCENEFEDISPIWCAICQKDEKGYYEEDYFAERNLGFIYSSPSHSTDFDEKKYPNLTSFDVTTTTDEEKGWIVSEEVMTTHVISMLRYMADNKEFLELMDGEGAESEMEFYSQAADNVEANGLNIFGFAAVVDKETLIEYSNRAGIAYIRTTPLN